MTAAGRKTPRADSLQGYADLARLGHDSERLTTLAGDVTAFFEKLAAMREIDPGAAEPAVTFAPAAVDPMRTEGTPGEER